MTINCKSSLPAQHQQKHQHQHQQKQKHPQAAKRRTTIRTNARVLAPLIPLWSADDLDYEASRQTRKQTRKQADTQASRASKQSNHGIRSEPYPYNVVGDEEDNGIPCCYVALPIAALPFHESDATRSSFRAANNSDDDSDDDDDNNNGS
jgi:hypothetical protein